MAKLDDIYEIAADNYGLVTTAQAEAAGVTRVEVARYAVELQIVLSDFRPIRAT